MLPQGLIEPSEQATWDGLLTILENSNNPVAKVLLGKSNITTSLDDSEELNKQIIAQKKTQKLAYPYLKCLTKWIEAVNSERNLNICISRIPIYIAPPLSPFTDVVRDYQRQYRRYMDILVDASGSTLSPEAELGRIIYSATLLGGLHHIYLTRAMLRTLSLPVHYLSERAWITLEVNNRDNEALERRIWEPDALTELFILNLSSPAAALLKSPEEGAQMRYPVQAWIRAFSKSAGLSEKDTPSFERLRKYANFEVMLKSPILAGYYRREYVSHSLKPEVWERILGMPLSVTDPVKSIEARRPANVSDKFPIDIESYWYSDLRKVLANNPTDSQLSELMDKFEREQYGLGPVLMTEWCMALLKPREGEARSTTLNRARNYMAVAGKYLISHSDGIDITCLNVDELAELYEMVIDTAQSPNHLRNLKKGLKNFHSFLKEAYNIGDIVDDELFQNSGILPVDATIITEDEFHRIRERLYTEPTIVGKGRTLALTYDIIMTLAYRTGMRRREVLYLNIADLIPSNRASPEHSEQVDLLVRPSFLRRLKTDASKRRLPLHALLEKDELHKLLEWWSKRTSEESENEFSPQLFALSELGWSIIEQEHFIRKLHEIMRDETGAPMLRFHHLRHSAASWILLRLMLSDLNEVPVIFKNQPLTQALLDKSGEFRRRLYNNGNLTRRHLYATAAILGHASPLVTLEHYIHTLDLLAYRIREAVPHKILMRASGIPEPTLYRHGAKDNPSVILMLARERAVKAGRLRNLSMAACEVGAARQHQMAPHKRLRQIWSAIKTVFAEAPTPAAEVADIYDIQQDRLNALIERVQYLSRLPANRLNTLKYETFRHNEYYREIGDSNPPPIYIPPWPRLEFARDLIAKYAGNVIQLASEPTMLLDGGCPVSHVVDYVMTHRWRSKHEIYFDSNTENDARGYIDLLQKIGLATDEIECRIFRSKGGNDSVPDWFGRILKDSVPKTKYVKATWDGKGRVDDIVSVKPIFKQFNSQYECDVLNNEESASYGMYLLIYLLDCMIYAKTH
jgi:integrase